MSKRLLIETRMNSLVLNESKSKVVHPGCLGTLEGPCADYKNATRNGNFYSRKLWEHVFADPIVKESLEDRILIGELDHPGDRLETKASNACIVMTDYRFDDASNLLFGTFDILDTPNGRILKSLLDYGCKIGVSSRGEGDVTTCEGIDKVEEDSYNFMGFDAVVLPAVKAAKPTLRESLNRGEALTLKESLMKEVQSAQSLSELNLIRKVVEATDLPDSDSLIESVNNKSQELSEGTTSSSNLLEDLETVTKQNGQLEDENKKLREELTTCKSRIGKLVKSRQRMIDQIASQKSQLEGLQSEYSSAVFESSSNEQQVKSLQTALQESNRSVTKLEQKIRSLESELSSTKSKVGSLEESLIQSQEIIQEKIKEVKSLNKKVEGLQASNSKKLTESQSRDRKMQESMTKVSTDLTESRKAHRSFMIDYVNDQCDSLGIDSKVVLESVRDSMTKKELDQLIESRRDQSDRYRALPFTHDPVISSMASVNINGGQIRVDEEVQRTKNFMTEVNKLF